MYTGSLTTAPACSQLVRIMSELPRLAATVPPPSAQQLVPPATISSAASARARSPPSLSRLPSGGSPWWPGSPARLSSSRTGLDQGGPVLGVESGGFGRQAELRQVMAEYEQLATSFDFVADSQPVPMSSGGSKLEQLDVLQARLATLSGTAGPGWAAAAAASSPEHTSSHSRARLDSYTADRAAARHQALPAGSPPHLYDGYGGGGGGGHPTSWPANSSRRRSASGSPRHGERQQQQQQQQQLHRPEHRPTASPHTAAVSRFASLGAAHRTRPAYGESRHGSSARGPGGGQGWIAAAALEEDPDYGCDDDDGYADGRSVSDDGWSEHQPKAVSQRQPPPEQSGQRRSAERAFSGLEADLAAARQSLDRHHSNLQVLTPPIPTHPLPCRRALELSSTWQAAALARPLSDQCVAGTHRAASNTIGHLNPTSQLRLSQQQPTRSPSGHWCWVEGSLRAAPALRGEGR